MNILAIDTSSKYSGIAFYQSERSDYPFLSIVEEEKTRAENMLPRLQELMDKSELTFDQVDLIAVCKGPGSFTGLRIGVTIAKTMAQFSGKNIVGISSLEALAYMAGEREELICPIIDARANRVYGGLYSWKKGELEELLPENLYFEEDLKERISTFSGKDLVFVGEGISFHPALEGNSGVKEKILLSSPVKGICQLAERKAKKGLFDSPLHFAPNYLRKSQAEMERERLANKKSC